jgi:hypothetical protein
VPRVPKIEALTIIALLLQFLLRVFTRWKFAFFVRRLDASPLDAHHFITFDEESKCF